MPSKKENETTEVVKETHEEKDVVETPVETTEFDLECSNGKGEDE